MRVCGRTRWTFEFVSYFIFYKVLCLSSAILCNNNFCNVGNEFYGSMALFRESFAMISWPNQIRMLCRYGCRFFGLRWQLATVSLLVLKVSVSRFWTWRAMIRIISIIFRHFTAVNGSVWRVAHALENMINLRY